MSTPDPPAKPDDVVFQPHPISARPGCPAAPRAPAVTLLRAATDQERAAAEPLVLRLGELLREAREIALSLPHTAFEPGQPGFDQLPRGVFLFESPRSSRKCLVATPWNQEPRAANEWWTEPDPVWEFTSPEKPTTPDPAPPHSPELP